MRPLDRCSLPAAPNFLGRTGPEHDAGPCPTGRGFASTRPTGRRSGCSTQAAAGDRLFAFMTLPSTLGREEYAAMDATRLAELIADGEVSASEVMEASLRQLDRWNPALNALIHKRTDASTSRDDSNVGEATSGPVAGVLAGVPFAVKDLGCAQAGQPHHRGTRFLRDVAFTAEHDSYLWQRFQRAGLVSIGRTNTPEFGSTITTEPLAYGPTRNPWNLDRTPGGSSGGAAALVAACVVPMAHGNDGGGSLRVPASMCGLVGLKPSRGRVSVGPDAGTSLGGFAVDGVVTRSVRDTALALDIMAGPEPGDPYWAASPARPFRDEPGREPGQLRIGIVKRRMTGEVRSAVNEAARLLDGLGHIISEDTHPTGWFDPEVTDQTIVIRSVGMASSISMWERHLGRSLGEDDVEPQNLYAAELGRSLPGLMVVACVGSSGHRLVGRIRPPPQPRRWRQDARDRLPQRSRRGTAAARRPPGFRRPGQRQRPTRNQPPPGRRLRQHAHRHPADRSPPTRGRAAARRRPTRNRRPVAT